MRNSLGISLGTANLIAVADGRPLILLPSEVTVRSGLSVTGFVERIGDPVPLVLADGSRHRADDLAAAAVENATRQACPQRRPDIAAVAVPAHWPAPIVAAMRAAVPHVNVVSDASAALVALHAGPGLPVRGVVALVDLGASGTSITLVDAGNGFAAIADTIRIDAFSGDLVDRTLLQHVLTGLDTEPSGTSEVASLTALRDHCRTAKARLSFDTATSFDFGQSAIRVTRPELDALIAGPLEHVIEVLVSMLHRHSVAPSQLAAIATVGGGARIPYVTQRLSEAMRRTVITVPDAQAAAATGAELLAVRGVENEAPTMLAPTPAPMTSLNPTMAAVVPQLAWSEETVDLSTPDVGETAYGTDFARPGIFFEAEEQPDLEPLAWYRRPGVLFAAAACFAAMAATGLVLTSNIGPAAPPEAGASGISTPVATKPVEPPAAPPAPVAVTETVVATAPAPRVVESAPQVTRPAREVTKQAAPQPVPVPAAPPPAPSPTPSPSPEPTPTPTPSPEPSPTPTPSPEPEPTPEPEPQPQPEPEPQPQPEPDPEPQPQPEPEPEPEPQPDPAPEEQAAPEEQPAPEVTEPALPECVPTPEISC